LQIKTPRIGLDTPPKGFLLSHLILTPILARFGGSCRIASVFAPSVREIEDCLALAQDLQPGKSVATDLENWATRCNFHFSVSLHSKLEKKVSEIERSKQL
jgi:hypothetical protein